MRNIFFDKTLQADFEQKGYITIPLISDEEIKYVLEELAKLRSSFDFFSSEKGISGPTFHATWLETNVDYKRRTYEIVLEVFSSHIKNVLADYKILSGNFIIKPSGKGAFGPHQHWQQIENLNNPTLTLWCPLVDVDESNATICVVEGSQRIVPNIVVVTCPTYFDKFQDKVIKRFSKPINMKAGEVLFFDDDLIHWSPNNDSSDYRPVIQAICIPSESKPVFFYPASDAPDRFEIYEVNDAFFIERKLTGNFERPTNLKRLGFVENKNRKVTEEEFIELLERKNGVRN